MPRQPTLFRQAAFLAGLQTPIAFTKIWEAATRKPLLSLRLSGLFLLWYAQRTFLSLLLNEPPRRTRASVGKPFTTG